MTLGAARCNLSTCFSLMTPRCRCRPPSPLANSGLEPDTLDDDRGPRRVLRRVPVHRPPRRRRRRAGRGPRDPRRPLRAAHRVRRRRGRAGERDARRRRRGPPAGPPRRVGLAPARGRPGARPAHPDRRRDRDGDDRRDPRRRAVAGSASAPTTPATASCSTCPATARGGSARRRAATATRSRRTGPGAGLVPRPPTFARYAPPRTHAGGVAVARNTNGYDIRSGALPSHAPDDARRGKRWRPRY